MAEIRLRPYQQEIVKKALAVKNFLLCACVGSGKTICAAFLVRLLLKNNKMDKVLIGCTVSSLGVFRGEFRSKFGLSVGFIEDVNDLVNFLEGKDKVALLKHSLIEDLGRIQENIDTVEDSLEKDYKRIMLIIDEAHKFSNHESWGNISINNIRHFFEKIVILTGTPYSSKLQQIYGLIRLIYPNKWKNVKEFRNKYVKTEIVKDWRTGKYLREEDVEYVNLPELRKEMEQFTSFYFPSLNINYIEHKTSLSVENYEKYREMCVEIYEELKTRSYKNNQE